MAECSMGDILRRGLSGTIDPRGRDNRTQFWLYLAMLFGPLIVVQMLAQIVMTFPSIDLSGLPQSDADQRAAELRTFTDMIDGLTGVAYLQIALYTLAALLLLTATARRLHDRGRSGWWSLILPFAVIASGLDQARRVEQMLLQMPKVIAEMTERGAAEGPADFLAFPLKIQAAMPGPSWPAIVAGVAMLWLMIELLRAGAPGDAIFGPQP